MSLSPEDLLSRRGGEESEAGSEASSEASSSSTQTEEEDYPHPYCPPRVPEVFQLGHYHHPSPSGEDEEEDETDHSVMERISKTMEGLWFTKTDPRFCTRATQTGKDPLTSETERLSFDIVYFILGRRKRKPDESNSQQEANVTLCLRKSVQKMLEKHSLVFNGMIARLHLSQQSDLHTGFRELSNELFFQNEISWSKIIALFAFSARLAQHCDQHEELGGLVFDVAVNLSQFAVEKLTPFLRQNGGWATLCEAFPLESDYESKIWHSLVLTGVGLTVIATIVALQH